MSEAHFNFSVIFDSEHSLRTGVHHIVTPVQLLYYKEYSEDAQGHVTIKGAHFSSPLQTVAIEVEIPGRICLPFYSLVGLVSFLISLVKVPDFLCEECKG